MIFKKTYFTRKFYTRWILINDIPTSTHSLTHTNINTHIHTHTTSFFDSMEPRKKVFLWKKFHFKMKVNLLKLSFLKKNWNKLVTKGFCSPRVYYNRVTTRRLHSLVVTILQLHWWLRWWRICLQSRRPRFNPWVGKISWRREWLPTLVFSPRKFHGQRSLVGYRIV